MLSVVSTSNTADLCLVIPCICCSDKMYTTLLCTRESVRILLLFQHYFLFHNYCSRLFLTFILLMCTFGRAPNNASKWEMGFNSVA
jgi:hypothetical protein